MGEVSMTEMAGEALTAAAVTPSRVLAGRWQVGHLAIARPYREHPTTSQTRQKSLSRVRRRGWPPTEGDLQLLAQQQVLEEETPVAAEDAGEGGQEKPKEFDNPGQDRRS